MLLYMYISPGKGQTTPWGQMLISTESPYHFAHLLQVSKQSLQVSPHIYSPGQGQTNPLGQNFNVNRKALSFWSFVASFKKNPFELLYTFFNVFSRVYSPRAGADNALRSKFWSQQKGFIALTICCKFKKISFNSDFIHICKLFHTCI